MFRLKRNCPEHCVRSYQHPEKQFSVDDKCQTVFY